MGNLSNETARTIAGLGARSVPAVLLAAAVLPTSLPATPTPIAVPPSASWAEIQCVYTADAGAASGGAAGFNFFVGDASSFTQIKSPIPADGYGTSDGPSVAAGVTMRFLFPLINVNGWARLAIKAAEDEDAVHPGILAVNVVWI